MYPVLPFGPMTIPTGPLVALVALTVGLEVAGRVGRRLHLSTDDVWNIGLVSISVSLIVARLWNVIQFWEVYLAEPGLILSLRPSGFVWSAGLAAGLIVAYAYLWRRSLAPAPMAVTFAAGALSAAALLASGAFLTGSLIGLPTDLPWALPYYGVLRHPVALYYALGFVLLLVGGAALLNKATHGRLLLLWLLGSGLLAVGVGAYQEGGELFMSLRVSQVVGLLVALAATLGLARRPSLPASPMAAAPARVADAEST
ncbi:MAG: prolipoprotein diacylglyceryl transferase [Caldilineaceae bacterium]|nr:prolipoprotein diacylglyceryl transferase [Caldilineaceae bacterium]